MSEVNIQFTPLYGAHSDTLCYLLKVNSFTFLLDCGWVDPFDTSILQPLVRAVSSIDAVLISHPDPFHLGALPYLVGKLDLTAPIYATGAIHKMGQMYMYSTYLTRHASSDFSTFDLDDIDMAFGKINQLRFRQEVHIEGTDISITPLPAGHLIGGSIWKISVSGEDFIYAVDVNHRRERHLTSAPLDSFLSRPAMLITDARSVGRTPSDREKTEKKLIEICMNTLRADGNVLLPIDAAGRLLELLLLFERHWSEHRLTYPVAVVGPMVHTTLEFARSQLEWMNESLVKSFGHSKDNPFLFRYVKPCASLSEARKLPNGPKVVLAVECSLECGPSRQLFAEWASDRKSTIIITIEPPPGSNGNNSIDNSGNGSNGGSNDTNSINSSLTSYILDLQQQQQQQQQSTTTPPILQLTLAKRVPLKGEELAHYLEEQEKRKQEEAMQIDRGIEHADDATMLMTPVAGTIISGDSPRAHSVHSNASRLTHHTVRTNVTHISHAGGDVDTKALLKKKGRTRSHGGGDMDDDDGDDIDDEDDDMMDGRMLPTAATTTAATPLSSLKEPSASTLACIIEGFEAPDGAVVPMFPHEDEWEHVEYDEYGGVVDEMDFQSGGAQGRLGRALKSEAAAEREAEATAAGGGGNGRGDRGNEAEVPTKIESKNMSIPLHATVVRLDFDGLSDERSMQTMLTHVAPRHLILVHGSLKTSETMAVKLNKELEGLYSTIQTPAIGDTLDIPIGVSYDIALDDKLMQQCAMHAVSGYELAWVNGVVGPAVVDNDNDGGGDTRGDEVMMDVEKKEIGDGGMNTTTPMHTLLPGSTTTTTAAARNTVEEGDDNDIAAAETTYGGVFIGDVRLSELKKALTNMGIASEFHAGALYCAGQVVVKRKVDGNGLIVEGALSDRWFKVKECLTSLYHIC